MTRVFCDANVALRWFHPRGEPEAAEALALARAELELRVLDLTYFEVGNVLARKRHWSGERIEAALRVLYGLCGEPVRLGLNELSTAAELAADHGLTFYDAAYWATAINRGARLATMDSALLAAGAGNTPAELVRELGLGLAR